MRGIKGVIHWDKISGTSGTKSNGTLNRKCRVLFVNFGAAFLPKIFNFPVQQEQKNFRKFGRGRG